MCSANERAVPDVVISGAGIAGLAAAAALLRLGHTVTLVERDEEPPHGAAGDPLLAWRRAGAPQFRHSHVFLGRLGKIIRRAYPELLDTLYAAGARDLPYDEGLPPILRTRVRPRHKDRDLSVLSVRRAPFEGALRKFVRAQPGARIISDASVTGILLQEADAHRVFSGFRIRRGGEEEIVPASVGIDATGAGSKIPAALAREGVSVSEESHPSGFFYFTRHYRLLPGAQPPEPGEESILGDLSYLKYCVFPAEHGHFTVSLSLPEAEEELRTAVIEGRFFDRICEMLPAIAPWVEQGRAIPVSAVFGMGNLENRWREYKEKGSGAIRGFFAIGDARICTNPVYGAGCTMAFMEAEILARVIASSDDPLVRAARYASELRRELRPYFDQMVSQDRDAVYRAERERTENLGGHRIPLRARLLKSFVEDGIVPASRGSMEVYRAFMRCFHMLDTPDSAMRVANVLRVARYWARGKKRNAELYPPRLGPARKEMLALLDELHSTNRAAGGER